MNDLDFCLELNDLIVILKNKPLNVKAIVENPTQEALHDIVTLFNDELTNKMRQENRTPMIQFSIASHNEKTRRMILL
jgi:hypothetical protein